MIYSITGGFGVDLALKFKLLIWIDWLLAGRRLGMRSVQSLFAMHLVRQHCRAYHLFKHKSINLNLLNFLIR